MGKASELEKMEYEIKTCHGCELWMTRKNSVFGYGNFNSNLMIIGEGPGQAEDETGLPFQGRAGQLLTKWLLSIGFNRDDVYICNILKCRPPQNRVPFPSEVSMCIAYLEKQIEVVKPKVIMTVGATAIKSLLNDEKLGISQIRGKWLEYKGIPLLPTYHPSFLLRQMTENNIRAIKEDLTKILIKINEIKIVK